MLRFLARNGAIGVGVYACARALAAIIRMAVRAAIVAAVPVGDVEYAVTAPLIASLPDAIAAAVAGIATVWLVDSPHPVRWAGVPAVLWLLAASNDIVIFGPSPMVIDLVPQLIAAALPSIVCLAAASMADWHRRQGGPPHVQ